MSNQESPYEPVVEAIGGLHDAIDRNTALLRDIKGLLIKPPVRSEEVVYPVATWRLHELTGLPICWLFGEYDRKGEFIAFVFDGREYRIYEGNKATGLQAVKDITCYGRRWESTIDDPVKPEQEAGVEIVAMKDGLVIRQMDISSQYADIATYMWRRIDSDKSVEVLYMSIHNYRISITPERLLILNR